MQSPNTSPGPNHAQSACRACRSSKKKCDKLVPKCSTCSRRGLDCTYMNSEHTPQSTSTSTGSWSILSSDSERQVSDYSIDLPTIMFLDPMFLQHGLLQMPTRPIIVPEHILKLLTDTDNIRSVASQFFTQIHSWMPFVSKKRFYTSHILSSLHFQADLVLLLLSFMLITDTVPATSKNARTSLYNTVKSYYHEVQCSTPLSIVVLQAGLVIALYELGHAVYPAAYLSVGSCAHYAQALGLGPSRKSSPTRIITLVEAEERRRVWWAVVILDRFVSVGMPARPLATANPTLNDLLPADDEAWDQGVVDIDSCSTLAAPMTSHMSKFALLCQAGRLLGQVLQHFSEIEAHDEAHQTESWVQLDRTLHSMLTAALALNSADSDQIAFIYNALIALHAPALQAGNIAARPDSLRTERAEAVMEQITLQISKNLIQRGCYIGRSVDDQPPWGLYFAFHVCSYHIHRRTRIVGEVDFVKSVKENFRHFSTRWNAAGFYLQLLEAHEVMAQQ